MTKKALLVGINYLEHGNANVPKLHGCINDALEISKMLIDAYNYKQEDIIILRDDIEDKSLHPTNENIIKYLTNITRESRNLSEFWIHFSGHGTSIRDQNQDERDGKDECIVPSDFHNGIITDDILFSILNQTRCTTFIAMDCCHSGTICDLTYSFRSTKHRGRTYYRRRVEKRRYMNNRNIYMLSGSRDNEYATDGYNYEKHIPMGTFTNVFMKSLRYFNHQVPIFKLHEIINNTLSYYSYPQQSVLSSSNPYPFIKFTKRGIQKKR